MDLNLTSVVETSSPQANLVDGSSDNGLGCKFPLSRDPHSFSLDLFNVDESRIRPDPLACEKSFCSSCRVLCSSVVLDPSQHTLCDGCLEKSLKSLITKIISCPLCLSPVYNSRASVLTRTQFSVNIVNSYEVDSWAVLRLDNVPWVG